jgi:hypothetical protein
MIEWLIEHYAEISVYGGITGLAFVAIILIAHFISDKIKDLKSKRKENNK